MACGFKRFIPMQQQAASESDSDAVSDINTGDRLISPCKRLRLHDPPDKSISLTNVHTVERDSSPVQNSLGNIQKASGPSQSDGNTLIFEKLANVTNNDFLEIQAVVTSESAQVSCQATTDCTEQNFAMGARDFNLKPLQQGEAVTTALDKAFLCEDREDDLDSSLFCTSQLLIPNNTPEKLREADDHSDASDIIINRLTPPTSENDDSDKNISGNTFTFSGSSNMHGFPYQVETRQPAAPRFPPERSVTFADETNDNCARRKTKINRHSVDLSVLENEAEKNARCPRDHYELASVLGRKSSVTENSDASAQASQNLQRRLCFQSAGNLLCPAELEHHRLSLQSYGRLGPLDNHGRQLRRVCRSSSHLHTRNTRLRDSGEHRNPQPSFVINSDSETDIYCPANANLQQRVQQHQQSVFSRRPLGDSDYFGSEDRLVNYGSIDDPHRMVRQQRSWVQEELLVDYGCIDDPDSAPQLLGDSSLNSRADCKGGDSRADRPVRRFLESKGGCSQQALHTFRHERPISYQEQRCFQNLEGQGNEAVFVRSASHRTLPGSGTNGFVDSRELTRQVESVYFPAKNPACTNQQNHVQDSETVGVSGRFQPDVITAAKRSRGSSCVLTSSSSHSNVADDYRAENEGGNTHYKSRTLWSGSSGACIEHVLHNDSGKDGIFTRSDYLMDRNLSQSGSQGSMNNLGRSVGSQQSVDSHGKSVGSQQSVNSHGKSVGSQQSVNSHSKSAGSQQSVDSRGNPDEAIQTDTGTGKKRKVLETPGHLRVAAYLNCGLVTVHVIEGRYFTCSWKPTCNSYIKLSLIPEEGVRKLRLKSKPVVNTNNPVFDEKFSLELQKSDENKRLLVSVWHKDLHSGCSEFLGCMSFGVKGVLRNKEVNGWYYLLTEEVGKKKHLEVTSSTKGSQKSLVPNIPRINRDVFGLEAVTIHLQRGKNGFGFTVVDEFPVKVGRVDLASPAEQAGLKPGDFVIKVNSQNVSRSTVSSVAKLVKKSGPNLLLHVNRPRPASQSHESLESMEPPEPSVWKRTEHIYESIAEEKLHFGSALKDSDNKENEMSRNIHIDTSSVCAPFTEGRLLASTPLSSYDTRNMVSAQGAEQVKLEAIHRLMSLELDFIDFMQLGVQRYLRPLRHCIFTAAQHNAVFQNVEKLVNISEYHMQQMQENAPSLYSESEDDSQSSEDRHFSATVAMIYCSKVHMFCQAHEAYAAGLSEANRVLSEMRQNDEFLRFIKNPPLVPGQPSVSAFIFRPLQHIKELSSVFQDIFVHTSSSDMDYATLRQVTYVLQESVSTISNMSNARVQSLTSLTSHTKSSGSSKASCTSSSSSSEGDIIKKTKSVRSSLEGLLKPSESLQTMTTVEPQIMKLQDQLVFSDSVPVFQLCQEGRHILHQGELFYLHDNLWCKIQMVLFSDMFLLCQPEVDSSLRVLTDPVQLHNVFMIETNRKHSTEMVLSAYHPSCLTTQRFILRTPTPNDLSTWKNLLQQKLKSI